MTTTEEATQLFHKAGETAGWKPGVGNPLVINYLRTFAELVKAEENEACAKVCESKNPHPDQWSDMSEVAEQRAVTNCAEAIRARMKP